MTNPGGNFSYKVIEDGTLTRAARLGSMRGYVIVCLKRSVVRFAGEGQKEVSLQKLLARVCEMNDLPLFKEIYLRCLCGQEHSLCDMRQMLCAELRR